MIIEKVISGGQSGVDRAALDAAIDNGIEHGGWCPKGRTAEDGVITGRYNLTETDSADYAIRTRLNVRDADGTLIIIMAGRLEGGTGLTAQLASSSNKPLLIIDLGQPLQPNLVDSWINNQHIKILNIAGPRESKQPGIYQKTYAFLDNIFKY